jgi:NAD(P)-dependent dehydrogenase (short-subunit alcohol dehydrogenase family)
MDVLDMFRLDGKVAIVTGASSGLGVAFAQALAQAGADVALGARRVDRLEETKAMVEASAGARSRCDRRGAARGLPAPGGRDRRQLGRVDVLVNNAGIGTAVPATRETVEQFRSVIDVNLNGCYWMAQACGRVMQPGSSIVNISSILGITTAGLPQARTPRARPAHRPDPRPGPAVDRPQGHPRQRAAPGLLRQRDDRAVPRRLHGPAAHRMLAGRKGDAAELSAALLFLASPAGGYVTGQTLAVDGGVTIT